jgi:hypothetical protein
MAETGCLRDARFQNLEVAGEFIVSGNSGSKVTRVVTTSAFPNVNGTTFGGVNFNVVWPKNTYLTEVNVYVSTGAIVSAAPTDDTIINVADGTNAIVGAATSINKNTPTAPGSAGVVLFAANANRTIGLVGNVDTASLATANASRFSTSDRLFSGVIYHDANGVNDGDGDGAGAITGNSAVLYVVFEGFRIP